MFKKIALALVVIILGILAYATTRPSAFTLQRQITIKAPPEKLFALINDFHAWDQWSPWAHMDPAMKVTYSGPPSGVGAAYEWTGNSKVGTGRMEIMQATPSSRVQIQLDFTAPMAAHNMTVFTLTPRGDSTTVEWAMSGPMPYVSKVMTIFVSMDKMVGPDFENGLSAMKRVAER